MAKFIIAMRTDGQRASWTICATPCGRSADCTVQRLHDRSAGHSSSLTIPFTVVRFPDHTTNTIELLSAETFALFNPSKQIVGKAGEYAPPSKVRTKCTNRFTVRKGRRDLVSFFRNNLALISALVQVGLVQFAIFQPDIFINCHRDFEATNHAHKAFLFWRFGLY
jgi:hypothetical protein